MNKVLLVQPNYRAREKRQSGVLMIHPPMGLAYIAAVLENNGLPVKILDANALNLSANDVVKTALDWGANLVGVSILTPAHNFSVEVAQKLPGSVMSVAGGAHATALPELLLKEGFSVVTRGEGEETFLDLALGKNLTEIPGISFEESGQVKHNPDRQPPDPNALPLPARHLLVNHGVNRPYFSGITQEFPWAVATSSRGCPYNCYYCNKLVFGRQIRYRSPENFMREIDFLAEKHKVKEVDIADDCFNFDLVRAKKILDLFISRPYKIHLRFSNGIRADKMDEEFLRKAKKAGCNYLAIGVETGSQEILSKIPKGETLDDIRKATALAKKVGIPLTGFFMIGLIGDTKETMQQTINFAKELDLDIAQFNIAVPNPGTRMWDMIEKGGGKIFFKNWDDFHFVDRCFYSMPGMADPKTVEMMYKKAYRDYYFRLNYILKHGFKYLSPQKIKIIFKGLGAVLRRSN